MVRGKQRDDSIVSPQLFDLNEREFSFNARNPHVGRAMGGWKGGGGKSSPWNLINRNRGSKSANKILAIAAGYYPIHRATLRGKHVFTFRPPISRVVWSRDLSGRVTG